jgi:hypothetical protein
MLHHFLVVVVVVLVAEIAAQLVQQVVWVAREEQVLVLVVLAVLVAQVQLLHHKQALLVPQEQHLAEAVVAAAAVLTALEAQAVKQQTAVLVVLEPLGRLKFGIKMYAMLDYNSNKVIAVFPPDVPQDKIIKEADGRTLIQMTPDNSPGYLNGTYENGKFYPPKELING